MFRDKRRRFVVGTIVLTLILLTINFLQDRLQKFIGIGLLGLVSFFLYWWSCREGLKTKISFIILVLPVYYSVGTALFWFLLPNSWVVVSVASIIYLSSIYILFLTSNVFSVSYTKTIALYRAARGVGFLLTLVTYFLVLDAIISLRMSYPLVGLSVLFVSFLLFLQGYWVTTLQKSMDSKLLLSALVSSLLQGQVSVILFFWPVSVTVGSLFLTILFYILLGLGQSDMEGRLFSQTVKEYLMVGAVVFLVMLISTSWTGY